ncbi:MAG: TRAP transporter substrate-binding protein [Proteobacteria bacterium]|nr:TRAP transporter substrate-binding protein [Pseudomonadota bacterium]
MWITSKAKWLAGALLAVMTVAGGDGYAQNLQKSNFKVIGPPVNAPNWLVAVEPFWKTDVPTLSKGVITADATSLTEAGLKGPEIFRLNKLGVADFVTGSMGYASGDVPEIDGLDMAGVAQDVATLKKMIKAYEPTIDKKFREKVGVIPLGVFPLVGQIFWCAAPINGPQDIKGKKVRVHGAGWAAFVTGLGGTTVTMAFGEVVPAMQRKVIDCAVTGSVSGNTAKWIEVATHLMPLIIGWSANITTVNVKTWDGMGEANRKFIADNIANVQDKRAEDLAEGSTNHGVWCSVGDPRCKLDFSQYLPLTKANLTLVNLTEKDHELRKRIITEHVLPDYTKRCGKDCARGWNETVGRVVGLAAPIN